MPASPLLANAAYDLVVKGGPIMAPILLVLLLAAAVLVERSLWWLALRRRRQTDRLHQAWDALAAGDFAHAVKLSQQARDPALATLHVGLTHAHSSFLASMQLHAARFAKQGESRLWILSTLITLAPLLGLLGTVVGIMHSFSFVGDAELAASKVGGGIGEALIATAFGLAAAILCLLPYNAFRRLLHNLRDELETAINHTELLAESARQHGHDLAAFARSRQLGKHQVERLEDIRLEG